jgi:hypothetical protein
MKATIVGVGLLVSFVFAGSTARADDPIVLSANREVAVTATRLDMD